MADGTIRVEVAYATPEKQWLVELEMAEGATAAEAVRSSGLLDRFPDLERARVGIFGEHVDRSRRLEEGDRVEIYRPLIADPKEARRKTARRRKRD